MQLGYNEGCILKGREKMGLAELFILAVGLSMDAFAVSVCKGLSAGRVRFKHMLACGAWFGGFQALMPLIGYLLGVRFQKFIVSFDHWIAFVLLGIIGANMIREALGKDDGDDDIPAAFGPKSMFPLAVATSIDALAVGVTFAFLQVKIVPAVSFIGVITFVLSGIGVKAGGFLGMKWKKRAEFAGGVILVLIGLKILIEHLFFS